MDLKYRVQFPSGRVVGPFTKEQIAYLILDKKITEQDRFQIFPDGVWQKSSQIEIIKDLFENSNNKKISKIKEELIGANKESETIVNLSLKGILNKQKDNDSASKNEQNKTKKRKANDNKFEFQIIDEKDFVNYKEIAEAVEHERMSEQITLPEVAVKNNALTADKDVSEIVNQQVNFDATHNKTIINTEAQREIEQLKKTQEDEKRREAQKILEKEKNIEEELEKNKEVDRNLKTEMINLSEMLPDIKKLISTPASDILPSDSYNIASSMATAADDSNVKNANNNFIINNDIEIDSVATSKKNNKKNVLKKRGVRPTIAMMVLFVLFYMLLDDDKPQLSFKAVTYAFPVTEEYVDIHQSDKLFEKGMKEYQKGDYLSKISASKLFLNAVQKRIKNDDALGALILSYAELLPNVPQSDVPQAKNVLFRLLKYSQDNLYKNANIATGFAIFFGHQKKYQTALNIIRNYLRVAKLSSDSDVLKKKYTTQQVYLTYLDLLIKAGELDEAKEVFTFMENSKNPPLEYYAVVARFYKMNEEYSKGKVLLVNACKQSQSSVYLWLEYADYITEEGDIETLSNILKVVKSLKFEESPLFYARYLEKMGVLSVLMKDNKSAVELFNQSFAIHESDELRSKLASLAVGGDKAAQNIIVESKIIVAIQKIKKLMQEKKWEDAFLKTVEAIDHDPNYIPAQLLLVEIELTRGHYANAISKLKELTAKHSTNTSINYMLIKAYVYSNNFTEAKTQMVNLSGTPFGLTSKYAFVTGEYYLGLNNLLLAIKWFHDALKIDPFDEEISYKLASIYLRQKKFDFAKNYINDAMMLAPERIDFKVLYTRILYETDGSDVAIGYLRDLMQEIPEDPAILSEIAIFYHRSGQFKQYDNIVKVLDKINNNEPSLYEYLLNIALQDDQAQDIVDYSKKLIGLTPNDLRIRNLLGEALIRFNYYDEAKKIFDGIIERLPEFPFAYYNLAKIYIAKNDLVKAMLMAEKEIKNTPEKEQGYYIKAEILKLEDKFPQAIKLLETAISINGKNVDVLMSLADIRYRQNYLDEARDYYLRALKEDSTNPQIHKQLGFVYKASGQSLLAIESLTVYLNLFPNAPDRAQVEALIESMK